jgi:hypothetical protein
MDKNLIFKDISNQPRTDEELQDALIATQKQFLSGEFSIMMIHYTVIIDALKELLHVRAVMKDQLRDEETINGI